MAKTFEGFESNGSEYEKFHFQLNRMLEDNDIEPVKINDKNNE